MSDGKNRVCSCGCEECGESLLIEWEYSDELEYRLRSATRENASLRAVWRKLEGMIRLNGPRAVAIYHSVGDPGYGDMDGFVVEDGSPRVGTPLAVGERLDSVVLNAYTELVRRDLAARKSRSDSDARARIRAKLDALRDGAEE